MAHIHMTEAEVSSNFSAVLEKVSAGTEVAIDRGDRTVAVLSPVKEPGRPIDECIALAMQRGSENRLDEDFPADLAAIINQSKPLNASEWD